MSAGRIWLGRRTVRSVLILGGSLAVHGLVLMLLMSRLRLSTSVPDFPAVQLQIVGPSAPRAPARPAGGSPGIGREQDQRTKPPMPDQQLAGTPIGAGPVIALPAQARRRRRPGPGALAAAGPAPAAGLRQCGFSETQPGGARRLRPAPGGRGGARPASGGRQSGEEGDFRHRLSAEG